MFIFKQSIAIDEVLFRSLDEQVHSLHILSVPCEIINEKFNMKAKQAYIAVNVYTFLYLNGLSNLFSITLFRLERIGC
jgi:hypothetical protein